jgi:hypothetical protein
MLSSFCTLEKRRSKMSLLLGMIAKNIPLHTWREVKGRLDQGDEAFSESFWMWIGEKEAHNIARKIVGGLSHSEVVDLVTIEFNSLPSRIRVPLLHECNAAMGTRSGNKTKGISRLDKNLGGKVLRREVNLSEENVERVFKTGPDGERTVTYRKINEAEVGASRKYAGYAQKQLSKDEKRRRRKEKRQKKRQRS